MLLRSDAVQSLVTYFQRLQQSKNGLWSVAFELLMIGAVVYVALRFLQGTRGERLLKSFWLILFTSFVVVRLVAEKLELDRIIFLYPYFVGGVVLTTLIAFQSEIRRGLLRLGDTSWLGLRSKQTERIIDPIVTAVGRLSQKKIGALIAIQRDVGVQAIIEAGVKVDAEVTAELLETIFWPGTLLHDMGVVIQHSRIAAAACQFPIAESGEVSLSLGSRHRAALGMSQECDAMVIVVSEETGAISVAQFGIFHHGLTPASLRALMETGLAGRRTQTGDSPTNIEAHDASKEAGTPPAAPADRTSLRANVRPET